MAPLEEERGILNAHHFKHHQKYVHAEEWRNLPEIPSSQEVCPAQTVGRPIDLPEEDPRAYQKDPIYDPSLPINIIDGAWPSKEKYVETHYKILREDAVASLRRAVLAFKTDPTTFDTDAMFVYNDVTFIGYQLARSGAACRICFSTERAGKRINWGASKRLAQGTIVALTTAGDLFQSKCRVAIVAARPFEGGLDQNPPTIDIFWGDIDQIEIDPAEKYIMVEAREGYFEASRHMLVGLQMLMTEEFKLAEHLVQLNCHIKAPEYLEENPYMDLTSLVKEQSPGFEFYNVDVLRNFPGKELKSGLNETQLQACKSMLTKRVSIIQGPPGTGKTFVSVCALKAMIDSLEPSAPPLIVSAQTNHALDQLLNHIMEFEPNILRLGGRSDKENLEIRKRTPYELRTNNKIPGGRFGLSGCRRQWEQLVEQIQQILAPLKHEALLTSQCLLDNGIITEAQRRSLSDSGWSNEGNPDTEIEMWLRDEKIKIERALPIDHNLPMEQNEDGEEEQLLDREEISADIPGPEDNDREALDGVFVSFDRKWTGRLKGKTIRGRKCRIFLEQNDDLYKWKQDERGELYRYFERKLDSVMLVQFRDALKKYAKMVQEYQVTKGLCNITLVRHLGIKIIGCTTTGLSKYRGFLSALQPRTIVIEEAGETKEGQIMAGMLNSVDQLSMVGDHLQLQASCNVKQLEEAPYYMKVSMFERLVNNSFEFIMLNEQRRMIPEIRKLLCVPPKPFYTNLRDHKTVEDRVANRPPIPGMGGRDSYFFHHQWPEARNQDGSCYNEDEALMIVGFFYYLTLNSVDAAKITVLTFYNGQRKLILKELKKHPGLRNAGYFNVFTVDSYQGEENDVILLSLVRSNMSFGIGFLDNRNRVVVALSRARRGLYLFGNAITLTAAESNNETLGREPLWTPLAQHLFQQSRLNLDGGLPLTCIRHGRKMVVSEPDDWVNLAGGCDLKCELGDLECGHPCTKLCHPFDHSLLICQMPCQNMLPCGHGCSRICGDQCFCEKCASRTPLLQESFDAQREPGNYPTIGLSPLEDVILELNSSPSPAPRATRTSHSSRRGRGGRQLPDRTRSFADLENPNPSFFNHGRVRHGDNPLSNRGRGNASTQRGMGRGSGTQLLSRENMVTDRGKGNNTARGSRGHRRNTATVNPQLWKEWDAEKSDAAVAEKVRQENVAHKLLNLPPPIFVDTYRSVAVHDGERSVGQSRRTILNNNPSQPPQAVAEGNHLGIFGTQGMIQSEINYPAFATEAPTMDSGAASRIELAKNRPVQASKTNLESFESHVMSVDGVPMTLSAALQLYGSIDNRVEEDSDYQFHDSIDSGVEENNDQIESHFLSVDGVPMTLSAALRLYNSTESKGEEASYQFEGPAVSANTPLNPEATNEISKAVESENLIDFD